MGDKVIYAVQDRHPAQYDERDRWHPGTGDDPAKYLVNPGSVVGPQNFNPGQLRNARPFLENGDTIFVFPVGVEGFRRSGQAQLGLHHYIGDNAVDGVTIHLEEARIELTGTFPGLTAQDNMVNCINILRAPTPDRGLVLHAPGVFDMEAYCLPETWEFSHDPDDRTHSIEYTITLVRIGEGKKVPDPHGKPPPETPLVTRKKSKGKPARIFTTKSNIRTFKAVAKTVYGSADKWKKLVDLNQSEISKWNRTHEDIPNYKLPTFVWPIGTKLRY